VRSVCDIDINYTWILCIIACKTGFLATPALAGRRLRTEIGVMKSTGSPTESAC
jgi:hypothetical protein